jgi:voltage-gated potassium channel
MARKCVVMAHAVHESGRWPAQDAPRPLVPDDRAAPPLIVRMTVSPRSLESPSGRPPGTAGLHPANPNSHRMADATRLERRLDTAVARATTPRGAAIVIASVSTAITLGAGGVMTVVDHENYPSIGSGLWWAAQTITTVGYGDSVPLTLAGRLVAVLVMLVGIGFLTVITAAITSTFVSRSRLERAPSDAETATAEQFRHLDSRLDRIEAALGRNSSS